MLDVGHHRGDIAGERLGLGGGRNEMAVAVEQAIGRHRLGGVGALGAAAGARREGDDPLEHLDEGAGQRQVRPAQVGGDVEEDQPALAERGGGDQRGAVGERRPGAAGERAVRLGQHLAGHRHVVGHLEAGEGALVGEAGERLRRLPGEAAAKRAVAVAERHRDQRIARRGQARPGEADEHAAALHPLRHLLLDAGGEVADVGHGDHRCVGVDEVGHGHGGIGVARLAHVGEGLDGARDVVERREQRLRRFDRGTGEQADAPAAEAVVEKLHRAGGVGARDLQAGDLVPDLDRQRDLGLGRGRVGGEGEGRIADDAALDVARRDQAGGGIGGGAADDRDGEGVGAAHRRLQSHQRACGIGVDGDRLLGLVGQEAGEGIGVGAADAVGEPHHAAERRLRRHVGKRGGKLGALGCPGARLQRFQALEDVAGIGRHQRLVGGLGGGQQRDRPAGVFGELHDAMGRVHHGVPAGRRRPAVVDHEKQVAGPRRHFRRRFEHRPGEREDDNGGEQQSERRQPPRAVRRLLVLAGDRKQQPRRRKALEPRLRRHQAQEVPDDRQRRERRQHADVGEGEGGHAARPARAAPVARLWRSARRACSASSGSVAGRSVRWTMKVQSSRRQSVFKWSRSAVNWFW